MTDQTPKAYPFIVKCLDCGAFSVPVPLSEYPIPVSEFAERLRRSDGCAECLSLAQRLVVDRSPAACTWYDQEARDQEAREKEGCNATD